MLETWISSLFFFFFVNCLDNDFQIKYIRILRIISFLYSEEFRLLFIFPSIDLHFHWFGKNIYQICIFFTVLNQDSWFWSWFLISTNPIEYDQILMLIKISWQTKKKNFSQFFFIFFLWCTFTHICWYSCMSFNNTVK